MNYENFIEYLKSNVIKKHTKLLKKYLNKCEGRQIKKQN